MKRIFHSVLRKCQHLTSELDHQVHEYNTTVDRLVQLSIANQLMVIDPHVASFAYQT